MILYRLLAFIARHGRMALVVGLIAGALLPGFALAMRPWIVPLIALLLFLSALRIGHRQVAGSFASLVGTGKLVLVFQLVMPLAAVALFSLTTGMTSLATFVVLMLAAAPISGSPNITAMIGGDPAPAMRQLIIGTALLPLTVLPVFFLVPAFGAPAAVLLAAGKLLAVIGGAAVLAFALREWIVGEPTQEAVQCIDGLSAIALGLVVIGLMSAVGPAMWGDPGRFLGVLALVSLINFGLQVATAIAARRAGQAELAAPLGIVAGNRNIALFLTALPAELVDSLLLLIGCYQIPMYLTPALLGRFYRQK